MQTKFNRSRPRGIYLLPNLFTIGALFAGFFAIVSSYKHNYENAAISIFIAMIMDNLDGRIARLTNTMTAFGAEFDSLADMVSFAIAPALLAYTWSLPKLNDFIWHPVFLSKLGWLSAFIYTVAVALRLARFNTQLDNAEKRYFQGLPCPVAAAIISSFIWLCCDLEVSNQLIAFTLMFIMIVTGVLMVSNIRFRSFKDTELKHLKYNVRFIVILLVVLAIVLISFDPSTILFALSTTYAISGPIATIWGLRQKKRLRKTLHKKI